MSELKAFLERGGVERDRLYSERIEGLGAAPAARHEHIAKGARIQQEIERQETEAREKHIEAALKARQRCTTTEEEEQAMAAAQKSGDAGFVAESGDLRPLKRAREEEEEEGDAPLAKAERKAAKKEKKEKKKRKKEEKKRKKKKSSKKARSDSDSSSSA